MPLDVKEVAATLMTEHRNRIQYRPFAAASGIANVTDAYAVQREHVRQQIKDEGALPVIPSRRNANKKAYCPKQLYRRRHTIENYFCRIKDWRRIATRYDKLARNFLAATTLVGAFYWIKL